MPIPGSSFLVKVKQKLRKTPAAEDRQNEDRQNREGPSSRTPADNGPGRGNGPEPIALAAPSPAKPPRGIHEVVRPFIDSEASPSGREAGHPVSPSPAPDQGQSSTGLVNEPAADTRPVPPAPASGQAEVSTPRENELAAAFVGPKAPEVAKTPEVAKAPEFADEGAVEGPDEGPMGESSPDSVNGKSDLGELFARKSVVRPTIKALLERHHPVNTRALSWELKEFADQLGISRPEE